MADPNNAPEMESDIGLDERATIRGDADQQAYLANTHQTTTSASSALAQIMQANAAHHARLLAISEQTVANSIAQQAHGVNELMNVGSDVHEVAAAGLSAGTATDLEALRAFVVGILADVVKATQGEE